MSHNIDVIDHTHGRLTFKIDFTLSFITFRRVSRSCVEHFEYVQTKPEMEESGEKNDSFP